MLGAIMQLPVFGDETLHSMMVGEKEGMPRVQGAGL
jgi:hypothetical protein